jgi:hypothetical protein
MHTVAGNEMHSDRCAVFCAADKKTLQPTATAAVTVLVLIRA